MQRIIFILLIITIATLNSCYPEVNSKLQSAQEFQKDLYSFYHNDATTPLKGDEKNDFKGIHFFELNENYIVEASFIPTAGSEPIAFPTSANKTKTFKEYGTVIFTINGQEGSLSLYQSYPIADPTADGSLFLPFKDATSGLSSYGAGRYIDLSPKDIVENKITIDFNKAYNPYCAYSIHYNCPLTPANNILNFPIEAGVKYP